MTKDEWIEVCGNALKTADIQHFHPLEIADVGRLAGHQRLKVPPLDLIPVVMQLCRVLLDLRLAIRPMPVLVNSWYRNASYNDQIGGVSRSMHLIGGAADVVKRGFSPNEVADILETHPDSDQFGIGRYKTFTHIDIRGLLGRNAPARW